MHTERSHSAYRKRTAPSSHWMHRSCYGIGAPRTARRFDRPGCATDAPCLPHWYAAGRSDGDTSKGGRVSPRRPRRIQERSCWRGGENPGDALAAAKTESLTGGHRRRSAAKAENCSRAGCYADYDRFDLHRAYPLSPFRPAGMGGA